MRSGQEISISDSLPSWDIFCAVVDYYGDIGVCWRLSRQLAAEHGFRVRLWADDLASLHRICPEIDPTLEVQTTRSVEVRQWTKPFPSVEPATVVVEAFACDLPESYIAAMAKSASRHVWINLEYLSAEGWVESCHGLTSPHPRLPLTKYFFFPGFTPSSGGLLAEKGLVQRRERFQQYPRERAGFWQSLGLTMPDPGELRVSLFSYENAPVAELFKAWTDSKSPVTCLIPEGVATEQVCSFFGQSEIKSGTILRKNSLIVSIFPFLEQDDYDRLLWACDFNFVRGEDSFVRAQWAAKPLAWQIYPQEGGAHWQKLQAFLEIYCADLPADAAAALSAFTAAWNRAEMSVTDWTDLRNHRAILEAHAKSWPAKLLQPGDLTTNLVNFCKNKLQ